MDGERFDRIAKALGTGVGRRGVLRGALGAALGAALGVAGVREAAAACLENGERCGGDRGTCCSGRCVRKQNSRKKFCKPAPGQGTCTIESDVCDFNTPQQPCNGDSTCRCAITTSGTSFCAGPRRACANCAGNEKMCVREFGAGARCTRCPTCSGYNGQCVEACPTQV